MLARFKDHATGAFYKGFRMLTMGWSDGHSFACGLFAAKFLEVRHQWDVGRHQQA